MADYKLYSHDSIKLVMHTDCFEAKCDEEAIAIARSMKKKVSSELWALDRLVARIPARRS